MSYMFKNETHEKGTSCFIDTSIGARYNHRIFALFTPYSV